MNEEGHDGIHRINNARLFRPEAVAAYANRRVGEPWRQFSAHAWIITLLLSLLASVGSWLVWTAWP